MSGVGFDVVVVGHTGKLSTSSIQKSVPLLAIVVQTEAYPVLIDVLDI